MKTLNDPYDHRRSSAKNQLDKLKVNPVGALRVTQKRALF
jgi:hypothetical protein